MKLDRKSKKLIKDLYKGRKHIDLTIGILKDGETEVVHWGPDHQVVEGPEVVYAVGSICKPFTTSWMAKLLAEGKLDLETPISEYIPGLPDRYYPNLTRLATHTSGSAGAFSGWLGLNRETGNAVFVGVNYGLVPAEDIGFSILRNLK